MTKNIESFEVILYLLPLPEPVGAAASGVMREFEMVMVRIRDTDGNEGCGYTALMVNQGAAVSKIIENVCAQVVKSEDPQNIEWIWSRPGASCGVTRPDMLTNPTCEGIS